MSIENREHSQTSDAVAHIDAAVRQPRFVGRWGDSDSDSDCQEIVIAWNNPGASTRDSDGVQSENHIVYFTASEDLCSLSIEHLREDSSVRVCKDCYLPFVFLDHWGYRPC